MRQSKKIAVTGGIGSGKSTVCKIIKGFGYTVLSCDEVYADILKSGKLNSELIKIFGSAAVLDSGEVDKHFISSQVFSNAEKRSRLNTLTHGEIFKEMFARASEKEICFFEVPLLFEGGYQNLFDDVIVVLRDKEERINSVCLRDDLPREKVENRINCQYDYDNSNFAQYYVIHNRGKIDNMRDIIAQMLSIIAK